VGDFFEKATIKPPNQLIPVTPDNPIPQLCALNLKQIQNTLCVLASPRLNPDLNAKQ
jgi:hypothetical protein